MGDIVARGAQVRDQRAEFLEGGGERGEVGQLAADMDGDALYLEARQRAGAGIGPGRAGERHAELVVGGAGRDLGMGAGLDVRIDAEGDRRVFAQRGRDRGEHFRLFHGFDIELAEAAGQRLGHFRRGLADAGEDDLLRRDSRRHGASIFADRDHVGAKPLGGERGDHGGIGIGLDREGDQRVRATLPNGAGHRRAEDAGMALHRRSGIDIDRRPDRGGDGGQRHVLAVEDAVAKLEMVHCR